MARKTWCTWTKACELGACLQSANKKGFAQCCKSLDPADVHYRQPAEELRWHVPARHFAPMMVIVLTYKLYQVVSSCHVNKTTQLGQFAGGRQRVLRTLWGSVENDIAKPQKNKISLFNPIWSNGIRYRGPEASFFDGHVSRGKLARIAVTCKQP